MHISSLKISNFKGVKNIQISDLKDLVVIAGPNGCGKSTILDAIRIFKSSYGGYAPNEMSGLMSELQIANDYQSGFVRHKVIAQDSSIDVIFEATITLSNHEIDYIARDLDSIILERQVVQQFQNSYEQGQRMFRAANEHQLDLWKSQAREEANLIRPLLQQKVASGRVVINREGQIIISQNPLLQFVFSIYSPSIVGIIDSPLNGSKPPSSRRETLQRVDCRGGALYQGKSYALSPPLSPGVDHEISLPGTAW